MGSLDVVSALDSLRAQLDGLELDLDLAGADQSREMRRELLDQIDDYLLPRLRSLDAPVLAVLGGSTGAGKSTITNSIMGAEVTTAGVLRPTTRAPVLVHHPDDEAWFSHPDGVLPGLARSSGATNSVSAGLVLRASDSLPAGLGVLDAPDIDSVEVANHDLAAQLLGAADLWIFVTTAARYADAVPWEYLGRARERAVALGVVINRIPSGSEGEVADHLREMLTERGLPDVRVFPVVEGDLIDGRIGAPIDAVRTWLFDTVGDAVERRKVVVGTVAGALASVPDRAGQILAAAGEQQDRYDELRSTAIRRYSQALVDIDAELDGGRLLRGEVLDQWREFVGTGAFMSRLESGITKLRDTVRGLWDKGPTPDQQAAGQLESNLSAVVRDAIDRAAQDVVESWEQLPGGKQLLADVPRGIDRASSVVSGQLDTALAAWEQAVLDLIREQAGDRVTIARTLSTGINGVGVALMVLVFSQTGGITGGEAAVATGTAAVSQAVLTAVFGEQAVRDLAQQARADLVGRIEKIVNEDRERFDDLVPTAASTLEELQATIAEVATQADQLDLA